MKCVNCGRTISGDTEFQLCSHCCKCGNLYDAHIERLKFTLVKAVRSGLFLALPGLALRFGAGGNIAPVCGTLLLYCAAANLLFSAAGCLSCYIQLRIALKKERAENAPDHVKIPENRR